MIVSSKQQAEWYLRGNIRNIQQQPEENHFIVNESNGIEQKYGGTTEEDHNLVKSNIGPIQDMVDSIFGQSLLSGMNPIWYYKVSLGSGIKP
jgi:hypothetical protein